MASHQGYVGQQQVDMVAAAQVLQAAQGNRGGNALDASALLANSSALASLGFMPQQQLSQMLLAQSAQSTPFTAAAMMQLGLGNAAAYNALGQLGQLQNLGMGKLGQQQQQQLYNQYSTQYSALQAQNLASSFDGNTAATRQANALSGLALQNEQAANVANATGTATAPYLQRMSSGVGAGHGTQAPGIEANEHSANPYVTSLQQSKGKHDNDQTHSTNQVGTVGSATSATSTGLTYGYDAYLAASANKQMSGVPMYGQISYSVDPNAASFANYAASGDAQPQLGALTNQVAYQNQLAYQAQVVPQLAAANAGLNFAAAGANNLGIGALLTNVGGYSYDQNSLVNAQLLGGGQQSAGPYQNAQVALAQNMGTGGANSLPAHGAYTTDARGNASPAVDATAAAQQSAGKPPNVVRFLLQQQQQQQQQQLQQAQYAALQAQAQNLASSFDASGAVRQTAGLPLQNEQAGGAANASGQRMANTGIVGGVGYGTQGAALDVNENLTANPYAASLQQAKSKNESEQALAAMQVPNTISAATHGLNYGYENYLGAGAGKLVQGQLQYAVDPNSASFAGYAATTDPQQQLGNLSYPGGLSYQTQFLPQMANANTGLNFAGPAAANMSAGGLLANTANYPYEQGAMLNAQQNLGVYQNTQMGMGPGMSIGGVGVQAGMAQNMGNMNAGLASTSGAGGPSAHAPYFSNPHGNPSPVIDPSASASGAQQNLPSSKPFNAVRLLYEIAQFNKLGARFTQLDNDPKSDKFFVLLEIGNESYKGVAASLPRAKSNASFQALKMTKLNKPTHVQAELDAYNNSRLPPPPPPTMVMQGTPGLGMLGPSPGGRRFGGRGHNWNTGGEMKESAYGKDFGKDSAANMNPSMMTMQSANAPMGFNPHMGMGAMGFHPIGPGMQGGRMGLMPPHMAGQMQPQFGISDPFNELKFWAKQQKAFVSVSETPSSAESNSGSKPSGQGFKPFTLKLNISGLRNSQLPHEFTGQGRTYLEARSNAARSAQMALVMPGNSNDKYRNRQYGIPGWDSSLLGPRPFPPNAPFAAQHLESFDYISLLLQFFKALHRLPPQFILIAEKSDKKDEKDNLIEYECKAGSLEIPSQKTEKQQSRAAAEGAGEDETAAVQTEEAKEESEKKTEEEAKEVDASSATAGAGTGADTDTGVKAKDHEQSTRGKGHTRKLAKNAAAEAMLRALGMHPEQLSQTAATSSDNKSKSRSHSRHEREKQGKGSKPDEKGEPAGSPSAQSAASAEATAAPSGPLEEGQRTMLRNILSSFLDRHARAMLSFGPTPGPAFPPFTSHLPPFMKYPRGPMDSFGPRKSGTFYSPSSVPVPFYGNPPPQFQSRFPGRGGEFGRGRSTIPALLDLRFQNEASEGNVPGSLDKSKVLRGRRPRTRGGYSNVAGEHGDMHKLIGALSLEKSEGDQSEAHPSTDNTTAIASSINPTSLRTSTLELGQNQDCSSASIPNNDELGARAHLNPGSEEEAAKRTPEIEEAENEAERLVHGLDEGEDMIETQFSHTDQLDLETVSHLTGSDPSVEPEPAADSHQDAASLSTDAAPASSKADELPNSNHAPIDSSASAPDSTADSASSSRPAEQ